TIELTVGEAQVATVGGQTLDLVIGKPIEIGLDVSVTNVVADAGVRDAAPGDAAPGDAPSDAVTVEIGDATIEVVGKKAELLAANETKWKPLEPGTSQVGKGAKIRLGAGTTAKLTSRTTSLELAGGSRAMLGEDYAITLELGGA